MLMSFDAEKIEVESGYDKLLQVVDLVDEMMTKDNWQEVRPFVDGLISDKMLYTSYEDSPEKVIGLINIMRLKVRTQLYLFLLDRMDGYSLSDMRFEEIIDKRHVARLCLVEKEAAQIKFLDVIVEKIRKYANSVVDDDVLGEILQERFEAA